MTSKLSSFPASERKFVKYTVVLGFSVYKAHFLKVSREKHQKSQGKGNVINNRRYIFAHVFDITPPLLISFQDFCVENPIERRLGEGGKKVYHGSQHLLGRPNVQ